MLTRFAHFGVWRSLGVRTALLLATAMIFGAHANLATAADKPAFTLLKGLLCNIDDSVFFGNPAIAQGKAGEAIDRYIDVLADAGVTVTLICTNARRTNYRSKVWDAYWDGYDPNGPDDQPFLKPVPPGEKAGFRRWIGNTLAVYQQGIDYPARMIARCRHDGISPWITLRMDDCHYNNVLDHPFHGSFWKKNPQFFIKGRPGYFEHCLDYAHPEVRDFYKSLIVETLDRYDIDGLELDFMREAYIFSLGEEAQGRAILTAWLGDIRKLVDAAAAKRGHPIRLGVRVPSRPETAFGMGFDAAAWAKSGLIDLLVVTPRWATLEFDMPLEKWRTQLGNAKVTLAGGLEVLYRPCPNGAAAPVAEDLARGAATAVLSRGADVVYLFNYFPNSHPGWSADIYRDALRSMTSLDALLKLPRTVGITYRDVTAPGETYQAPLPATGKDLSFSFHFGPVGDKAQRWRCTLLLGLAPVDGKPAATPAVSVNGKPCTVCDNQAAKNGRRAVSYDVPLTALVDGQPQAVKVTAQKPNDAQVFRVERLEASFTAANAGKDR